MAPLLTDPLDLPEGLDRDIDFDAIARGIWAAGPSGVSQLIDQAVQLVAGEWVLNQDTNIDYYKEIFNRPVTQRRAQDIFRVVISAVPGVKSVAVTAAIKQRVLTVTWTATLHFGDTVVNGSLTQET